MVRDERDGEREDGEVEEELMLSEERKENLDWLLCKARANISVRKTIAWGSSGLVRRSGLYSNKEMNIGIGTRGANPWSVVKFSIGTRSSIVLVKTFTKYSR